MRRRLAKVLALTVSISGVIVIIGWILNINIIKAIHPGWISMKFDTAIAFVASGVTLYFIARTQEGRFDYSQIVLCVTTLIIMLLMGILLFSTLFGIRTGAEELFIKENLPAAKTVIPGRPSVPTMFNFILIALAGILAMANIDKLSLKLKIIGIIVTAIGGLAVIGYIINAPALYYYMEGINSAIALHTSILFVLLGTGLLCLSD